MALVSADPTLLALIQAPAAFCSGAGTLVACNPEFLEWAGAAVGAHVEVHSGRGILLVEGRPPRTLRMTPLAGGGWLGLAMVEDDPGALAAVSSAVARRLGRLEASLAANTAMALHEQPPEPVARCLRETLAASQELRILRGQVEAIAGKAAPARETVCLRTLLREAVEALPAGTPVDLAQEDGDFTVVIDRPRFFHLLVALLGVFGHYGRVHAAVTAGDPVRIHLSLAAPGSAPTRGAEVDALRRYLAMHGGRLLLEPGAAIVLEIPSYTRGATITPGLGAGTVLVVDDDESTLAMMGAVLRRSGFRVLTAENGVAASALLRLHAAEIVAVVADAVLPGRSGVELAAEARGHTPGIPVLLVSGHPSDLLGADDFVDVPLLCKPFGARALADKVRAMMAAAGR